MGRYTNRLLSCGALATAALFCLTGCQPKRIAVDTYPPGTIHARYAPADDLTDCLVASTAMAANYVLNADRYDPGDIRAEIEAAGHDHTSIADLAAWTDAQDLRMIPLRGDLTDQPPVGLVWWVVERGYPIICVINKYAGNPEYNHAVLVIGFEFGQTGERPEWVYLLDPASPKRLLRWDRLTFAHFWGSARKVMLPVFEAPADREQAQREPGATS